MKRNTRTTWWTCSNSTEPLFEAKPNIRFTFVRHGSTHWNSQRRFQGQIDIPLNAMGRAQAEALAELLAGEPFDYAVSSDLSRAYETARAIRGDLPVERDPRWREFAFGEWEGLTWEQIVDRWPHLRENGSTAANVYQPAGGESFDAVRARVSRALAELGQSGYENVLVVTHAGPLHAMLHTFFGDADAQTREALGTRFVPASVTRISLVGGKPEILALNEVAHLRME